MNQETMSVGSPKENRDAQPIVSAEYTLARLSYYPWTEEVQQHLKLASSLMAEVRFAAIELESSPLNASQAAERLIRFIYNTIKVKP